MPALYSTQNFVSPEFQMREMSSDLSHSEGKMTVHYREISDALEFVSSGQMCEHEAFLNRETGEIYWHSEICGDFEALPEDIDEDEKYISIPHKNELDLGRKLVFKFTYQFLPDEAEKIEGIFRKRGAYSRFKDLLEWKGVLDKWYEFESQAQERALRQWCDENTIKVDS